ncbi:MAG: vacuolar-type H+-ATPase subunit H [Oscillospiraceae bacterium]|nr:vacuolar-type H+-ATPase subunit H [Oscillospiraceae bacterium]
MSVFDILDDMDDMLDNAKVVPITAHKVLIDGDRLRELVNDIRLNMPKEMKRAQTIDYDCDLIMKEAQSKSEKIIRDAEERAKAMVDDHVIVEEAKKRAHEILTKTKNKCENTKSGTSAYVLQSLTATEAKLNALMDELRKEKANWEKK